MKSIKTGSDQITLSLDGQPKAVRIQLGSATLKEMRSVPGLLLDAEVTRQRVSSELGSNRAELGQYFTPSRVARLLASFFDFGRKATGASLLDPGAGVGSLTAAFVARWATECPNRELATLASEIDERLLEALHETLAMCVAASGCTSEVVHGDFLTNAINMIQTVDSSKFDYIIMNPPYMKLRLASSERRALSAIGIDVPNIYAAFVALAIRLLKPGGQLVAIIPRSFSNGTYFKSFRTDLLRHSSLKRIHVIDSRKDAFSDTDVLQENVIIVVERDAVRRNVEISTSASLDDQVVVSRSVPFKRVIRPDDPECFIHLTPDERSGSLVESYFALGDTLNTLGLKVSTGRVVDFRTKENLRQEFEADCVPLIYPTHLEKGFVVWPKPGKKPNGLKSNASTESLLLPAGTYVVVKRFSSKEERRRIVATLVSPNDLPGDYWAFENHLNVFHIDNSSLPSLVAIGLTNWLNSTVVDVAFRQFSGHTQVNAGDLRSMRFPSIEQLNHLGSCGLLPQLPQETIDEVVTNLIEGFKT